MKNYTFALLLSSVAINASAAWDGLSSEPWTKGDGTEANPFQIENEAQFIHFQKTVTDGEAYEGKFFCLATDLDMGGHTMNPIGFHDDYSMDGQEYKESKFFLGSFDGNYKTIDNVNIQLAQADPNEIGGVGIFAGGRDKTLVKNLIAGSGVKVDGSTSVDVGGIMGIAYGSTIENCQYSGKVKGGSVESGGICGFATQNAIIRACIFSGSIQGNTFTGGIAGATDNSVITDCLFSGSVDGNEGYWIAGHIGWAKNSSISNSLAIGKITGLPGSSFLPGISPVCAELEKSTADNCYYVASLTGCDPFSAQTGITAKTAQEASSATMVETLNGGHPDGLWATGNNGMPTLAWTLTVHSGIAGVAASANVKAYVAGSEIVVEAETAEMTVFDINGRVLISTTVSGRSSFAPETDGVYIVSVRDASGAISVFKLAI